MLMQNPNIPEDWKQTIRDYIPKDEREAAEKAEILTLIDREGERLLLRDCAYAHMTASSIIVNGARTKTLMAFHKIYQSWAWTGGHADGETDLLHVAMREAKEETGIEHLRLMGGGLWPRWKSAGLGAREARKGGREPSAFERILSVRGRRHAAPARRGGRKQRGRLA